MTTTQLDPAPAVGGGPVESRDTSDAPRPPYSLRLPPDVAADLGRYVSAIVAKVSATYTEDAEAKQADHLTLDLSAVTTVPIAQLVLLVDLLRRDLGNHVAITLSGVRPAILGSLVAFSIPRGVDVIDSRGRRWRG